MEDMEAMLLGARKLVCTCANVQPGERVLVLTDTGRSQRIAESIYRAALEVGASVVKVVMEPGAYPGAEVPDAVAAAMKMSDVILGPTTMSLGHTRAGMEACAGGARMAVGTEFTEDMLTTGGIKADFEAQRPLVEDLARRLSKAREVRLTTPGGTDLRALTDKREARAATGLLRRKGERKGPPNIEVYVAPLEGTAEGIVVVDASATALGLVNSPIRIVFRAGRAVEIVGGEEARQLRKLLEDAEDPNSWNLAEIALGLNPCGRVTGHIIEDEGTLGTCHVALGNNVNLGGNNPAKLHVDLVMWRPTLYLDGEQVFADDRVVSG